MYHSDIFKDIIILKSLNEFVCRIYMKCVGNHAFGLVTVVFKYFCQCCKLIRNRTWSPESMIGSTYNVMRPVFNRV